MDLISDHINQPVCVPQSSGYRTGIRLDHSALFDLLDEVKAKFTVEEMRRAFIEHRPDAEALLDRIAWTARRENAFLDRTERIWMGLEIFVRNEHVLKHYPWWSSIARQL